MAIGLVYIGVCVVISAVLLCVHHTWLQENVGGQNPLVVVFLLTELFSCVYVVLLLLHNSAFSFRDIILLCAGRCVIGVIGLMLRHTEL